MKLISCYVSSFGKLKDYSFSFSSGLNTIKEDNGWGKSTLATFIKAMFYGLDGSAKRSLSENERKKYKPWNSTETFGGSVNFVWGDKEYKIERFFGNKESDDVVKLYDVKTGKSFTNTESLGKRIFEVDEEGFLSTTYFSQKDFEVKSNTSITAKFNSLCEVDDVDVYERALTNLTKKAKAYKYSGDRGLISDCKRELRAVNEEIEKSERISETSKLLKKEIESLSLEVNDLKVRSETLAESVANAGRAEAVAVKKARLEELRREKTALEEEKKEVINLLNGNLPTPNQITAYMGFCKELSTVSTSVKLMEDELLSLSATVQKEPKQNNKRQTFASIIICLLFFIEGISTIWFNLIAGIIGFSLSAVCAILLVLLFKRDSSHKSDDGYSLIIEQRRNKLNEYKVLESDYKAKLNEFLGLFNLSSGLNYHEAVALIKDKTESLKGLDDKLVSVEQIIKEFSLDPSMLNSDFPNVTAYDIVKLKSQFQEVQNEYAKKTSVLASKMASEKSYAEMLDKIVDLESRKCELTEKIAQYTTEYDVLVKTTEFFKKADENLKIKYRTPLQDSLNKYLSMISNGEKKAKIDIDLNVTIEENSGEKQTDYYSKGYQNLFEICKRFALTDVLFTGEKPFIILDDPFYNLDDKKIKASLSLIKRLSEEYQIIYFVCHESRSM